MRGMLLPKKWALPRAAAARWAQCAALLVSGFVLSGATVLGQSLPLGACLVAALPIGLRSVAAAIGAVAGYLLRCEGADAAQFAAMSLLMLAAGAIFQGTRLPATRWFMPLMASGVCAVLGGVCLMGERSAFGFWAAKWLLAGLCTLGFRSALGKSRGAVPVLTAAVVSGLGGLGGTFDIGLLAACAVSCAADDLTATAAVGLALDLTGNYGNLLTMALLLPALTVRLLRAKQLTWLSFLVLPNVVLLCFGEATGGRCVVIACGVALGMLLRELHLFPLLHAGAQEAAAQRLSNAAEVLETLCRQLPADTASASQSEAESVYDGAAERVCRCCARFHRCWQHRADETYRALSTAAPRVIEQGVARAEDFPQSFRETCCHLDGFVTAVNRELEGMLYRRRYRVQLRESRQVVAEEFGCVADYLRCAAREPSTAEATFLPAVGISTLGKDGSKTVGDRGACFSGENAEYFVLLCDGMGTGKEASELSAETVRLLERLLRSGLKPEAALKIMNGMEILRGTGCFTTVDLLRLDLRSGTGMLYKWGAAPSYYRTPDGMKKIGTAAPPPGVGVGGDHLPERYRLSLRWGEMLVLVSDGAGGTDTEEMICQYRGQSPRELAALLIAGIPAEDDRTAVCVSLRPRVS